MFQEYVINSGDVKKESYILEIYSSLKLLHCNVDYLQLSSDLIQKVYYIPFLLYFLRIFLTKKIGNMSFLKNPTTKVIPILEDVLKKFDEEFLKNYWIEGCFLTNVYLPKKFLLKK